MLLAIDVGNTNTVFAVFHAGRLLQSWRIQTQAARSADEYLLFLSQMCAFEGLDMTAFRDVLVSCVVPEAEFSIRRLCEKYLGCCPVFVRRDLVPMDLEMERPEDAGADRLVNALAVRTHYETPAVVIDFGTATTFDVVNRDGAYVGGVIAPGIDLSLNALHSAASKLPKVRVETVEKVIGKTTIQAMQSGLYWGYRGLIEGVLGNIAAELEEDRVFVLATGGLAPLFAEDMEVIDTVDEHLTLKGLCEIHKGMREMKQKKVS